jgi:hypothetical protein
MIYRLHGFGAAAERVEFFALDSKKVTEILDFTPTPFRVRLR